MKVSVAPMKRIFLPALSAALLVLACSRPAIDRAQEDAVRKSEANKLIASGDYAGALTVLKPLLTGGEGDPQALSLAGEALWKQGDYAAALANFEASIRIDYYSYRTHMLLAQMLMENGKTGRALTEFELAAQYGSDRALPHYNYGLALYESGMKEDALKQWTIAYNLANDNPMYVAAMGMAYTGEDDRKALAFYEKAESLGAGGHKFNHNYGLLLERLGQFKRAEERFQVALQESPDNPSYELSLAALFMKTKAYSMAVPLWKRLLQAKPGELSYHIYLARAYLELEEYDEAKATLTQVSDKWERAEGHSQALDSSPSSPGIDQAFEIFAMACRGKGDLKEALVYIRKALEIAPQNPVHLNNYGVILAENGMIDEARAQWEKALSLDPGNEAASKNLLIYKK